MSSESPKVGVIDIGSNSIKLLIARNSEDASIESVHFATEEVRIGEGITGAPPTIEDEAIDKAVASIGRLVREAEQQRADAITLIATSAVRDAANKEAFARAVENACGRPLRILSGNEEAALIGRGILCDPNLSSLQDFTLIDLGGGSMERILFKDGIACDAKSFQLGAVRLSSRFVGNRAVALPSSERSLITQHVIEVLKSSGATNGDCPSGVAVLTGGSATLIASSIPDAREKGLSLSQLSDYTDLVCDSDQPTRINDLALPPSRADIMPTAAATLSSALAHLGCREIHFSNYNLRFGAAQSLLAPKATKTE